MEMQYALILYALIPLKQHKKHLISDIQPKCIRSVSTPCCLVETARRRNIILKQEQCSKYLGVNYNWLYVAESYWLYIYNKIIKFVVCFL